MVLTGSTPVSDTFKVGGSLVRFNRDGFGDNLNLEGIENYAKDSWGARVSAESFPIARMKPGRQSISTVCPQLISMCR